MQPLLNVPTLLTSVSFFTQFFLFYQINISPDLYDSDTQIPHERKFAWFLKFDFFRKDQMSPPPPPQKITEVQCKFIWNNANKWFF
jgi:hypothetical protein